MYNRKKIIIIFLFTSLITLAVGAINPVRQKERNLKVLPKDISDEKLDSIMNTYTKALGVKCEFCHARNKNFIVDLDFASDAEPMKENARAMMQMVININKTYFYFDSTARPEYLNVITCKTCHRGEPIPQTH